MIWLLMHRDEMIKNFFLTGNLSLEPGVFSDLSKGWSIFWFSSNHADDQLKGIPSNFNASQICSRNGVIQQFLVPLIGSALKGHFTSQHRKEHNAECEDIGFLSVICSFLIHFRCIVTVIITTLFVQGLSAFSREDSH